jgi:hypothetical protein
MAFVSGEWDRGRLHVGDLDPCGVGALVESGADLEVRVEGPGDQVGNDLVAGGATGLCLNNRFGVTASRCVKSGQIELEGRTRSRESCRCGNGTRFVIAEQRTAPTMSLRYFRTPVIILKV